MPVTYNVNQRKPLPIQKGEIVHNVKASFEEYLIDLQNNGNKNISCFQKLFSEGLKAELKVLEAFEPDKIQL